MRAWRRAVSLESVLQTVTQPVVIPYALAVLGVAVTVLSIVKISPSGGRANLRLPGILVGLVMIGYGLLILFTAQR